MVKGIQPAQTDSLRYRMRNQDNSSLCCRLTIEMGIENQSLNQCPRCAPAPLRAWHELTDEEREVVRRLPGATGAAEADRKALHRWCPRCWYETGSVPLNT
jgi:ribosomal protein S27AE